MVNYMEQSDISSVRRYMGSGKMQINFRHGAFRDLWDEHTKNTSTTMLCAVRSLEL